MSASNAPAQETYNPWTVVNLVFNHLAEQGLHPTLGETGPPGEPAAALLRSLGIEPTVEGDSRIPADNRDRLTQLRQSMLGEE
ncbi:MAG TPA: hypothetical protein VG756_24570 [Pseudonocardiaceae bacterium]|nr:hypothetical protein [Pseudonocardiaceae bacterium]